MSENKNISHQQPIPPNEFQQKFLQLNQSIKAEYKKFQVNPDRLKKQESKSAQTKNLYRKIPDHQNPHIFSTGNLNKKIENTSQNQLTKNSIIKIHKIHEQIFDHQSVIDQRESEKTSEKMRKPKMTVISYKPNNASKIPSWILNRKNQQKSDLPENPGKVKSIDRKDSQKNVRKVSGKKILDRQLIKAIEQQKILQCFDDSTINNGQKKRHPSFQKYSNPNSFSHKQTNQTIHSNINEDNKFLTVSNKLQKITELELINLHLDQQLKDLKFKFENLEDDKNFMADRMKSFETQIALCQGKLKENILKEDNYREIESSLRGKIEELERRLSLAQSKEIQKHKTEVTLQQTSPYYLTSDKQLLQKKNQQIQKLNQIISKLREKVRQLNHQLSQQKISTVTKLRNIQHQYELQMKDKQIEANKLICFKNQGMILGNTHNSRISRDNNFIKYHVNGSKTDKLIASYKSTTHLGRKEQINGNSPQGNTIGTNHIL